MALIFHFSFSHNECSLPDVKILDSFKLKEFADDNFKFDKNGRKLSKWVESNFSFSHSVVRRLVMQTRENQGLFGKVLTNQPFPKQALVYTCLQRKSFENSAGKGEIVRKSFNPLPNDKF